VLETPERIRVLRRNEKYFHFRFLIRCIQIAFLPTLFTVIAVPQRVFTRHDATA
jgi:hypothetical protein